ncbi:MAG: ribose 5-phosphate isomerase B [Defluviitaleaceae bacterium]|nr:ribose 5-phosphate isomerase B [Defluviitaleaceae bacterium]
MKIVITNDHAATELKTELLFHLLGKGHTVEDMGSNGDRAEYPQLAHAAAKKIADGEFEFGVFLCGTGAGMCIAANKVHGIRAIVCTEPFTAKLAREHNDAQVLCIGARVVGRELAKMIVDEFIEAKFEGGRHATRVETFMAFESRQA